MIEELLEQNLELKPVELKGNGMDDSIECEIDFDSVLEEIFI